MRPKNRDLGGIGLRFERDEDADLAEPLGNRGVHVGADGAGADGELGRAPERYVSPMVAIACAIASSIVPLPCFAFLIFSTSAPLCTAASAMSLARPWK